MICETPPPPEILWEEGKASNGYKNKKDAAHCKADFSFWKILSVHDLSTFVPSLCQLE